MARSAERVPPLDRLGRWAGTGFVPVGEGSVTAARVHVMTHGWGRGLADVVSGSDGFLAVWDESAITEGGSRFDRWFGPLAKAITADDPEAVVLAFSWIDESATSQAAMTSLNSQLRTTVNGQRLSTALRQVLSDADHQLHLIGFSHGAKVATVAAALLDPPPSHLTILDSPDNLVPILGGAFNDLASYLRIVASDSLGKRTFVDNYPSQFGVQYGTLNGLGSVVDVTLDPNRHPLPRPPTDHAYAWAWYLETAQNPDLGVGYAWSPLRTTPVTLETFQLRQTTSEESGPFDLGANQKVMPGTLGARLRTRAQNDNESRRVLSTDGKSVAYGLFWRRSGDLWASAPADWRYGPDDAAVTIWANRTERARTVKGWSEDLNRVVHVPLGGARLGPMIVRLRLESDSPAEVSLGKAQAVHGFVLPAGSELKAWARPAFFAIVIATAVLVSRAVVKILKRR